MERASALSAVATGHSVTVFSYEPEALKRANLPVVVEDARRILARGRLPSIVETRPNSFTNILRLEAMRAGCGTWFDLDMVFLAQLPDRPYLLGYTSPPNICNAIMRMPEQSPLLSTYLDFCLEHPDAMTLPWWPWRRKVDIGFQYVWRYSTGRKLPRIQTGPPALTHFVHSLGLSNVPYPSAVFYPVTFTECRMFLAMDDDLGGRIRPETVTVHLWRAAYAKQLGSLNMPPEGTWLQRKCAELEAQAGGAPRKGHRGNGLADPLASEKLV